MVTHAAPLKPKGRFLVRVIVITLHSDIFTLGTHTATSPPPPPPCFTFARVNVNSDFHQKAHSLTVSWCAPLLQSSYAPVRWGTPLGLTLYHTHTRQCYCPISALHPVEYCDVLCLQESHHLAS